MKKTIGIILRENIAGENNDIPLYGFRRDLIPYLRKYNINVISIPVMFENANEFKQIKEIIDFCDGIIFPGGAEIKELDYKIMKYLYKMDKPTLGICLGMQIMGKTFNGSERTKIEEENHKSEEEYVHSIIIRKDSLLYNIIGEDKIKVNSRHRNKVPNTQLDCVAYSEDNVLEAIEDKNKKFFLGVQWHPESLMEDIYSKRLFDYLIKKL